MPIPIRLVHVTTTRGPGAGIKTITTKMTKPYTNSNIWIRNKTRVQFSKTVSSQTRRYRRCFFFCIRPGKNLNHAANSVCSIQTGSRTTNYLYLLHLCQWNEFKRRGPKGRRTDTHTVDQDSNVTRIGTTQKQRRCLTQTTVVCKNNSGGSTQNISNAAGLEVVNIVARDNGNWRQRLVDHFRSSSCGHNDSFSTVNRARQHQ